jgi:biopolymer transport protein ExbB
MLQASSLQAAVRPLEATLTRGIAALVASGVGEVPLDPTRGSALKELVQRTSLIHIFKQGGPIMWPLLVVSILALAAVIERTLFLVNERRRRNEEDVQELLGAVQEGNIEKAVRIGSASKDYVARAMTYALQHREKSLANALMYANAQEVKRFSRGLPVLDTAITIAPLLGLLGTVTGMMHSFSLIGGDLSAPGAITGGIAEALIATAFGLGIAIIALIPFNVLNSKIDEARHALEAASAQIELLVHPPAGPMNALAMAASHGRIA